MFRALYLRASKLGPTRATQCCRHSFVQPPVCVLSKARSGSPSPTQQLEINLTRPGWHDTAPQGLLGNVWRQPLVIMLGGGGWYWPLGVICQG